MIRGGRAATVFTWAGVHSATPCWATVPRVHARAGRRQVELGGPSPAQSEAELPGPKPASWQGAPKPFAELNSLDNKIKCITEQSDSEPEAEKSRFFFS